MASMAFLHDLMREKAEKLTEGGAIRVCYSSIKACYLSIRACYCKIRVCY